MLVDYPNKTILSSIHACKIVVHMYTAMYIHIKYRLMLVDNVAMHNTQLAQ